MKPVRSAVVFGVILLGALRAGPAAASVAVVVEHQYTIGNTNFSAFGYNPVTEHFRTGGYGAFADVRWSHILDDTVLPWQMEGSVLLTADQFLLFARNGNPGYTGSLQCYGMAFNALDSKYFVTVTPDLRTGGGQPRLDEERDLVMLDDRLPDSLVTLPTAASVANTGGVYTLTDVSLVGGQHRAAFLTRGVPVGTQLTLYPVGLSAACLPGTYTVTQVVSETQLRLDRDPCQSPNTVVADIGYIMSMQPHVTLKTFRQEFPYFVDHPTIGPNASAPGAISTDGLTLYVGEQTTDNLLAVNTQAREDFSVFVSKQTLSDYVYAERATGRLKADLDPRVYGSSFTSGWSATGTGATVNASNGNPVTKYSGSKSIAVTFTLATGLMDLTSINPPLSPAQYSSIYFWMHGGTLGGHSMRLVAYNSSNVDGTPVPLAATVAEQWKRYEVSLSAFGLTDVKGFKWVNSAGAAQPAFYIDEIRLKYLVLPSADYGDFSTNGNALIPLLGQVASSADGRIWFVNGETDDILWTVDGTTLHKFLTSNQVFAAVGNSPGVQGMFATTPPSTGLMARGLAVDRMGTVYWGDNATREIWKCPATGDPAMIRCIASQEEIMTALGLGANLPRGMSTFVIRGNQLLTYNYIDSNTIFKADLNTSDYGDYDGDIDVDADDYGLFFGDCMAGPEVMTPPPGCTAEEFSLADLDKDQDVDMMDYRKFQELTTGPLPP